MNSDGTVGADFTGHISAAGIDMIAADVAPATPAQKIIWHKTTKGGATVADVTAYSTNSALGQLILRGVNPGSVNIHGNDIEAELQLNAALGHQEIQVFTNGNSDNPQNATILDGNGDSTFVKKSVWQATAGNGQVALPNTNADVIITDAANNLGGTQLGSGFSLDRGWWMIGANIIVGADSANWTTIIAKIGYYNKTNSGVAEDPNFIWGWTAVNTAAAAPGTGQGWTTITMARPIYNPGPDVYWPRLIARVFGAFGGYAKLDYRETYLYAYRIG